MKLSNAKYIEHLDTDLNNNPLSEAVQVVLNKDRLYRAISHKTSIQKNFWELPEIYQQTQLRQLTEVHVPLTQTWNLYIKMMSLILFGYVRRNPMSKEMRMFNARLAECVRNGKIFNPGPQSGIGPTTAPSSLVKGDSGCGKTKGIRGTLGQIQQVITHTSYKGEHFKKEQLTWVSFDLPPNGSPKAMTANFFRAVDNALGTSYAAEWSDKEKYSVDKLMAAMQHVASTHCLGLVHIDELQFMIGYKKIKNSPSLQTLETLFNKIGVPIILSSTQQGVDIFETLEEGDHRVGHDITTVRRMLNDKEFTFSTHLLDSDYFNEFFDVLFPSGIIHGPKSKKIITEFKKKFNDLSCGLPAIMTRLAHLHHETLVTLLQKEESADKNYVTFDVALLERVFNNQFSLIAPALVHLRNGNRLAYEKSIRNSETKKSTFSNKEAKKEAEKVERTVSTPVVLKTDSHPKLESNKGASLSLDGFKVGIEVHSGKS